MKPAPDKFVADTTDDSDESELQLLICDGLAPLQFPAAERTALRDRLLRRVGESVRRHAGLLTVRSGDGVWRTVKAGIRARILWNGGQGSSALVEFAAGATLPAHRHRHLEEGIVLHGSLRLGDLELGPGDYHVSPPGSRHAPISSGTGGLAYLRGSSLGHTGAVLGELLGALVPGVGPAVRTVFSGEGNWEAIAPGVEQKILWQDGEVISRFLRLAAGASLPGHGHAEEEECMMLSGDAFFGDVLVQAGEFHLAPTGSEHGELSSDNGALLFLRGRPFLPLRPGA
ncbi:MAG TPA: cupin domain-containing protein [Accumulibacter sp.]|uniref:cupin domain-containing protein n=1 Tax=Accumulibacter sp. TaxID=2053492 RepID=UPI0025E41FE4|nr:cupin domain-containing protein [Accumulibacter sp.]MCM8597975.1 cupin domain-containing protein [Accumulibacter sp.]MCM8662140.1 cupin domain-containing protein [Accumulibacter sp.]HNC52119.1 cupin domain-containing protein [Accumulibacter sp.]